MPRPVVQHDGFLVPNASTVSNPRMAEPDRIDFNTIAHALWGVIEGCEVTVSGATASITGGMAVVNGMLVTVVQASTSLGVGGAQDRFDLIAVDQGGTIRVIIGTYSNDPVFPDPPKDVTVLAAVFAPATQSNFTENVVDKRKFLQKQLLTKLDPGEMLIRNANGTGNHYSVTGGGLTSWLGDTTLWRTGPGTLRVQSKLIVDDSLNVGGEFKADSLTAVNKVKARNIESGPDMPSGPNLLAGSIFQDETTGKVFLRQNNEWKEVAVVTDVIPVGTVITCLEKPGVMEPKGWVALNGQTVTEATHPRLFTVTTLLRYVTSGTAEGRDRVMKLPNLNGCMPMMGFETSGAGADPLPIGMPGTGPPGTIVNPWQADQSHRRQHNWVNLTQFNLPYHLHYPYLHSAGSGSMTGSLGSAGSHAHSMGSGGGSHNHPVYDYQHSHYGFATHGAQLGGFAICSYWGGATRLTAPSKTAPTRTRWSPFRTPCPRMPTSPSVTGDRSTLTTCMRAGTTLTR